MTGFDFNLKNDLSLKYITVSLSNSLFYNTKFSLEGTQISMQCGYNPRNKLRWVILTDSDGDVLLTQTFLKYKKRCELNFYSNLNNLNYYLTLKPKIGTDVYTDDYDYSSWANDFEMCFVGYSQDLEDRLQNNLRFIRVGN